MAWIPTSAIIDEPVPVGYMRLDELDLKSLTGKLSIGKTNKFKFLVPVTPIIVNAPSCGPIVPATLTSTLSSRLRLPPLSKLLLLMSGLQR